MLEGFLDVAQSSSEHDIICQSVIILMGSLAKHFDKDDPKVCNYPLQYFNLNCELSIIFSLHDSCISFLYTGND